MPNQRIAVLYEGIWVADEWEPTLEAARDLILSNAYSDEETPPGSYRVEYEDGSGLDFTKAHSSGSKGGASC